MARSPYFLDPLGLKQQLEFQVRFSGYPRPFLNVLSGAPARTIVRRYTDAGGDLPLLHCILYQFWCDVGPGRVPREFGLQLRRCKVALLALLELRPPTMLGMPLANALEAVFEVLGDDKEARQAFARLGYPDSLDRVRPARRGRAGRPKWSRDSVLLAVLGSELTCVLGIEDFLAVGQLARAVAQARFPLSSMTRKHMRQRIRSVPDSLVRAAHQKLCLFARFPSSPTRQNNRRRNGQKRTDLPA